VALALLLTVVLVWAGIAYGIPMLAKGIAFSLPASTEKALGQDALEGLDKLLLEPTRLAPVRQDRLRALFAGMSASIEGASGYRLELRASRRIGANALALPSGIVVITDALADLASNDAEIVAVLAHEIGHLKQRHQLRRILQDSATAVLIIAVTGDVGSIASLAAAFPTLLVQSRYSREFEREADDFALDYLKGHDIDPNALGEILLRMEKQRSGEGQIPDYLSSHPATRERAERLRQRR
jgi:predicted Zn-dependent protease